MARVLSCEPFSTTMTSKGNAVSPCCNAERQAFTTSCEFQVKIIIEAFTTPPRLLIVLLQAIFWWSERDDTMCKILGVQASALISPTETPPPVEAEPAALTDTRERR